MPDQRRLATNARLAVSGEASRRTQAQADSTEGRTEFRWIPEFDRARTASRYRPVDVCSVVGVRDFHAAWAAGANGLRQTPRSGSESAIVELSEVGVAEHHIAHRQVLLEVGQ
jgi:hypothetical protein